MHDAEDETEFVPGEPPPDGCCCWPLWGSLCSAGQRGLAVVVGRSADGPRFWLQSRGVDFEHEPSLPAHPAPPKDVPINLVASRGIRHCPWCGKRLEEVFAATPAAFKRFAEAHREFAPPAT